MDRTSKKATTKSFSSAVQSPDPVLQLEPDGRLWWLLAALLSLLLSTFIAQTQSPQADVWRVPQALSGEWWRYPIETNAFKRLPVINTRLNDIAVSPTDSNLVIVVGDNGLIARSEDGGDSWEKIQLALGENATQAPAAASFSLPFISRAVAAAAEKKAEDPAQYLLEQAQSQKQEPQQQQLQKNSKPLPPTFNSSNVGGADVKTSPQPKAENPEAIIQSAAIIPIAKRSFTRVIFTDAENVWLDDALANGGAKTVLHSDNAGKTWRPESLGQMPSFNSVITSDAQTRWQIDRGRIQFSKDDGANWQPVAERLPVFIRSIKFVDAKTGYAVGSDGAILRSRDSGANWQALSAYQRVIALTMTNSNQGWLLMNDGNLLRSDNGGSSWLVQEAFAEAPSAMDFISENEGWIAFRDGQLLRTDDGGASWKESPTSVPENVARWWESISFIDALNGWGVRSIEGNVWQTLDGAESWTLVNITNTRGRYNAIDFVDANRGWVAGLGGTISATSAGGSSWQSQQTPLQNHIAAISFGDTTNGIVSGDFDGVLITNDGGGSWQLLPLEQAQRPSALARLGATSIWIGGEGASLLRSNDAGASWQPLYYQRSPAPWYYASWLLTLALLAPALRRPQHLESPQESIADVMASDSPLKPGDPDPLGFAAIARSLSRFIRNENTQPPLTLAVTGPWGSGKSSLMNLLSDDLQRVGFMPVWFNVWHHQKEEHLLAALLANIRRQAIPPLIKARPPFLQVDGVVFRYHLLLQRGPRHWILWLVTLLVLAVSAPLMLESFKSGGSNPLFTQLQNAKGFGDLLAGMVNNFDILAFFTALVTAITALYKAITGFGISPAKLMASIDSSSGGAGKLETRLSFRYHFAKEFKDVTQALEPLTMVIMIDDLDRCRPHRVLEILEAVNFLVSSGNCIVVLGMDYDIVRQSIALEYRELAEQMKKENPRDGATKAELFAAEYLEKLINIQVPVPILEQEGAGRVLTSKTSGSRVRAHSGSAWRTVANNMLPYVVALSVIGLGLWWGQSMLTKVGETAAQRALQPVSSATAIAPATAAQTMAGTVTEGRPGSDKKTAAQVNVIAAPRHMGNWYWPAGIPLFILLCCAMAIVFRPRNIVVKDSPEFSVALRAWAGVVLARRHTPRTIKRFLNRTRYFAMRLRDSAELTEPSYSWLDLIYRFFGSREKLASPAIASQITQGNIAEDAGGLPTNLSEPLLVALSAIHHYRPELIDLDLNVELQTQGMPAEIAEAIESQIQQLQEKGEWPPSTRQLQAFRNMTKGIEVH